MGWSYRIARIRGIDVKVHVTFAFVVLAAAAQWASLGAAGMAFGVALILLLFACVTMHEFGHALAAQSYGIPVREIVLLPIGGVAFLGRSTRHPMQELVIAAAGPAVNVAIVALLAPLLYGLGAPLSLASSILRPEGATPSLTLAVQWLLSANIGLVLFNMIPAFPLDGGRILRGLLGLVTDWATATRWATTSGQVLATAMGTWGVIDGRLMLVFIAVMIFIAAGQAAAEERSHTVLSMERVGDACNRHALALHETDRVSTVTRYLLTSYQPDFAVMRGARMLGVVRRGHVLQALAQGAGDAPVTAIMTNCPTISAELSLDETRRALVDAQTSVAAVFTDYGFVGLVSLEDIAEAETVLSFARGVARATPMTDGRSGGMVFRRSPAASPAQ